MNAYRSCVAPMLAAVAGLAAGACSLSPKEELGRQIFNDEVLSANKNQACAACHGEDTGGTGPSMKFNAHGAVYEGSFPGRFGNRKPPSSAYATLAPRFDHDAEVGFVGGNFWDGRATGWRLGNPAADQAQGPFLNPVEQALPDAAELVARVCATDYGRLFRDVWGPEACSDAEQGYVDIALSIAAFEGSREVNRFSSKYDAFRTRQARLDPIERRGLKLFTGRAQCANCHVIEGDPPLFTDFTFDNLGIPLNPENPFYGMDEVIVDEEPVNSAGAEWRDPGLGGFLRTLASDPTWRSLPYVSSALLDMTGETLTDLASENLGKHRVPTLRNVDKRPSREFVKAYGHNGYFKSLKGIVHFYNTRDILPRCEGPLTEAEALAQDCWPAPEIDQNVNTDELGNLGLSDAEEDALVAFMATLSDERSR